jgi:hypothetical protein
MDNTTYEFFIRRAWDCDRFKHGADTDTWEGLTREFWNYQEAIGTDREIKCKRIFEKRLAEVKDYLNKAYDKLLSNNAKNAVLADQIMALKGRANIAVKPADLFVTVRSSLDLIISNDL